MSNQPKVVQIISKVLIYIIFISATFIILFPLFWMFYTSFKDKWEIFSDPYGLPLQPIVTNYVNAWSGGNFQSYFFNSIIVTFPSIIGVLVVSAPAAYAFARLKFKGKTALFSFFLLGIMVPSQAIAVSSFQLVSRLGLVNSYFSLIFTYLGWCSTAILILATFFKTIPEEIEEAALIDGASTLHVFWNIALPLARPAMATVSIFYFVWVWNDFLFPLLYLQEEGLGTIPLGLMQFQGQYRVDWGTQTAALSIAVFVPLTFYMLFQKSFVEGLTAGALKG